MARRGKSRRYIKGNVDEGNTLGTLASFTAIKFDFGETVASRTLVTSIVATYTISDFTSAGGDGPVMIGIAHSDYSFGEIEQVIEATGSWDEGDLPQQEIAKRKVRKIGVFTIPTGETVGVFTLNDGNPIKTKLNWILTTGDTLSSWAYNMGTGALTAQSNILVQGHVNMFPT